MSKCEKVKLSELIIQKTDTEQIVDMENEHYITLSLYGKGARERVIKDGKYPVPFTGYRVSRGQFIYSRIDARNGAYDIIGPELDGFVVSKDFPVFDINESKVLPHFLRRAVLSDAFINQVKNSSFGATNRMRIKEDIFEGYSIPLPGLSKQQEIVDILDRVETIINSRQQELEKLDDLIKARFVEMFGDPNNSMESSADKYKIGELCDVTKLAGFEFTEYITYQDFGEIIMLRGLNCKQGKLVLDNVKYIDRDTSQKLPRSRLYRGDILMTYAGTIGDVAMVDEDDKYHLAPNVAKISIKDKTKLNPIFLVHLFMYSHEYIMTFASQVAQASINMQKIRDFEYIIPPMKQQIEFEQFANQVDKSKAVVQKSLDETQVLFDSLMQKYFG